MTLRFGGHFLPGPTGPLAVVLWEPPHDMPIRLAALYLPPVGEEMNKSRRMVGLQARALAARGCAVAILDPRGTGDSGGDHAEATWDGWQADVRFAWDWLDRRSSVPIMLWGLRIGGLLAADLVLTRSIMPAGLLLWQPVINGRSFFNQFLRLGTARTLTGPDDMGVDSKALRSELLAGKSVEVGGYAIHPALLSGAEAVDLNTARMPGMPIIWRETSIADPPAVSPVAKHMAARLAESGANVDIAAVSGPSFWATQEIANAPQLIATTTAAVERHMRDLRRVQP